jgi:hypothetical protein
LTNPVADGIPVHRLPPEVLAPSREGLQMIPLSLLRQGPPDVYRLGPGDVLGVYVEGVLGDRTQPPPVRLVEQSSLPPAMGFPIPVRENGTISLPLVPPVLVQGLSLTEAEGAIKRAFTSTKEVLKPGRERIIVTLLQPRTYHVLVVRADAAGGNGGSPPVTFAGGILNGPAEAAGSRKRGVGFNLELPAYENDLLNALSRSGGLPGLDARNEVLIQRGYARGPADLAMAMQACAQGLASGQPGPVFEGCNLQTIRIPIRLHPGAEIPFKPEDIILHNGDIVVIQARDSEVFYTGGLLQSGQYALPRDYDLDVVQAIALVRGPIVNGSQSTNNFTGQLQSSGVGFPNPSLVSIIRQVPCHGQLTIRVNLNRALEDPRERILIQPNDLIILQDTPCEAIVQYCTTSFFGFHFLGTVLRARDATGTVGITAP